jgi:hypothetical protein
MLKALMLGLLTLSQVAFGNDFHVITLDAKENVRYLAQNILEVAANLPAGSVVKYPSFNR